MSTCRPTRRLQRFRADRAIDLRAFVSGGQLQCPARPIGSGVHGMIEHHQVDARRKRVAPRAVPEIRHVQRTHGRARQMLDVVPAKPRIAEETTKAGEGDAVIGREPHISGVIDPSAFLGQGELKGGIERVV